MNEQETEQRTKMPKLQYRDFINYGFDVWKPVRRDIPSRKGKRTPFEPVIEGVVFTDNYLHLGYTYYEGDNVILINFWDKEKEENIKVLETILKKPEDFEKAIKKADKKLLKRLQSDS